MLIDIIFLILAALAIFKGLSRGFIIAVFSFFAIIIGVAAAMKFSYLVSNWVQSSFNFNAKWLPILSFLIVLLGVILLVRLVANMIQAAIDVVMLGWLNKLGGAILYLFIYLFVYSIVLFYLTKMGFISNETIAASHTYAVVEPFGPKAIDILGNIIPFFKDIFRELSGFFEKITDNPSVTS
jgi:membrane protein required for colicin V production